MNVFFCLKKHVLGLGSRHFGRLTLPNNLSALFIVKVGLFKFGTSSQSLRGLDGCGAFAPLWGPHPCGQRSRALRVAA